MGRFSVFYGGFLLFFGVVVLLFLFVVVSLCVCDCWFVVFVCFVFFFNEVGKSTV